MTAELEPDFVLVATSVKAILLFLEIINVDPELLAGIEHQRACATFACHPSEIIERAEFPDDSAAFTLTANQCRYIPFHPEIGLWIPKADMFQHRASIRAVGFVSARRRHRRPPLEPAALPALRGILSRPASCRPRRSSRELGCR